jgi:hypothetical protein
MQNRWARWTDGPMDRCRFQMLPKRCVEGKPSLWRCDLAINWGFLRRSVPVPFCRDLWRFVGICDRDLQGFVGICGDFGDLRLLAVICCNLRQFASNCYNLRGFAGVCGNLQWTGNKFSSWYQIFGGAQTPHPHFRLIENNRDQNWGATTPFPPWKHILVSSRGVVLLYLVELASQVPQVLNSLSAIGGHDRQLFDKLLCWLLILQFCPLLASDS